MSAKYSEEEIRRLAPGYRGKPENFDPTRVGKKNPKQPPRKTTPSNKGPQSPEITPPTNLQTTATPQRNESIITEAIFGVDVSVTEIAPKQDFRANYAKLIDISREIYDSYRVDEKQLDRQLEGSELDYYLTGCLWIRLIEIKAKQGDENLTSSEKDIRKAVSDETFNLPQPAYAYLKEIGTYSDKMGKETRHSVPSLPVAVAQGFGGYHANAVTVDSHNLFEEVPSLGIAGDMIMALASPDANPTPNFHIARPPNSVFTENLVGMKTVIGPRRPETAQRLAGFGINAVSFAEYIPGTRFSLRYMKALSDIIGTFETFKVEKTIFKNLGLAGGESQVIVTRPNEPDETMHWRDRTVQPTSAATSSTAIMGASYIFGFQLYKEDGPGTTLGQKSQNWSCVVGKGTNAWDMPADWHANRNAFRNLPPGIGTERFRALSIRQDSQTSNIVRRMIKTIR